MVEFITLFIGLVTGLQTLEVSVTEDVAKVDLRLDGETVATLEKEPWRAEMDLGPALVPRVLEAVAYDTDDLEVYRAEQTLNVARSRAMLRIILGRPRDGGTRDGRLVWLSADNAKPERVTVTLDGELLEVVARRAFELPFSELESEAVHMVNARADFPGGVVATATLLLGGAYGETVTSQLTAVPVVMAAEAELPPLGEMKGWLTKGGQPLEVMAVEQRGAEVVVVRDRSAFEGLYNLAYRFREQRYRQIGKLSAGQSVRILEATPRRERLGDTGLELDKFRLSEPLSEGYGGVPWILGMKYFPQASPDDRAARDAKSKEPLAQHLADAVANAGLTAAASGWLRAVVLVLGEDPEDESQWPAARVRDYLRTLRVPLYVWSTARETQRSELETRGDWGPATTIATNPEYLQAVGRLTGDLARQRLLWVRGEHFVHDVRLASHVSAVRLAE